MSATVFLLYSLQESINEWKLSPHFQRQCVRKHKAKSLSLLGLNLSLKTRFCLPLAIDGPSSKELIFTFVLWFPPWPHAVTNAKRNEKWAWPSSPTGMIWSECKEIWEEGPREYVLHLWNLLDFGMLSIFVASFTARFMAFLKATEAQLYVDQHVQDDTLQNVSLPPEVAYFTYGESEGASPTPFWRFRDVGLVLHWGWWICNAICNQVAHDL